MTFSPWGYPSNRRTARSCAREAIHVGGVQESIVDRGATTAIQGHSSALRRRRIPNYPANRPVLTSETEVVGQPTNLLEGRNARFAHEATCVVPVFCGADWLLSTCPAVPDIMHCLIHLCSDAYLSDIRFAAPDFRSVNLLEATYACSVCLDPAFTDADVYHVMLDWLSMAPTSLHRDVVYLLILPPGLQSGSGVSGRDSLKSDSSVISYAWVTSALTAVEQASPLDAYSAHLSRELVELLVDADGRGVVRTPGIGDGNDWCTQHDIGLCLESFTRIDGVLAHKYWAGEMIDGTLPWLRS